MMVHNALSRSLGLFTAITLSFLVGCSSPPPLGDDPRAAKLADALMTAFAAKRSDLVDQVAKDLDHFEQEKVVSPDVAKSFRNMIASSQQGDWKGASEAIKTFIRGQRK